ncbi:MAG: hypothetical protein JOZ43_08345 [Acidobacteriales bacterium]|nr:hypothetical protein [Terriglobales bacterium]
MFGKIGAVAAQGEVPFQTSGGAGTPAYKTNGTRKLLANGTTPILPLKVLDQNGRDNTSGLFTGQVKKIVYASALPTGSTIGAYFVTYLQRVSLQLQVVGSNVVSNTILLQMAEPAVSSPQTLKARKPR